MRFPSDKIRLPEFVLVAVLRRALDPLPSWLQRFAALLLLGSAVIPFVCLSFEKDAPAQAFWTTLLLFAATVIANEYLGPKPRLENARPTGAGDFKVPTATEGRTIPLLWGRARIDGSNITWYGDIRQEALYQKVKTGLWSSKTFIKGYKNYVAWQQILCRGPNVALRGLWIADKKVFTGNLTTNTSTTITELDLFGGEDLGAGGWVGDVDFFTGGASQPVSSFLDTVGRQRVTTATTPTAPRYTGTSYLVIHETAFGAAGGGAYIGNDTAVRPMSVDVQRIPDLFAGQTSGENSVGSDGDANPINVIYEYLTNKEWGMGLDPSEVDVGSGSTFLSASDTIRTEGNGFSMLLDQELEGDEFLKELERHIDGIVYRNLRTNKWEVKLARDDYDINTAPLFDETNSEVLSYSQSTWEDTNNQVQVLFHKRDDDYNESFALAQDTANALIRGEGTVATGLTEPVQMRFPGVKTPELAANLAWRELRTQAYPLARATLAVSRSFWDLTLGTVVAWTSTRFKFTKLPMRIVSIDYGRLEDNAIKVELVQDVFYFEEPSFGVPPDTRWVEPEITLAAIPSDEQLIFEAPRAIYVQEPTGGFFGQGLPVRINQSHMWCGAARQNNEHGFNMTMDYSAGLGTDFRPGGQCSQFMVLGTLVGSLPNAEANPVASIQITAPQAVASAMNNDITAQELGQELAHLIKVGNEFMLATAGTFSGGVITFTNVYRGVLDSAQESHSASDTAYFMFMGGAMLRTVSGGYLKTILSTDPVREIRLRTFSSTSQFSGTVTGVNTAVTNRQIRPYPPAALLFNGSGTAFTTPSLEGAGSGLNGFRIDVDWWRRNFENQDEVAAMLADDTGVDASHEVQLEVRADPTGSNTLVGAISAWTTGTGSLAVTRLDIITVAAAGTVLRFKMKSRHDFSEPSPFPPATSNDIESRYTLEFDTAPTSSLVGQFYFGGGVAVNVATNSYTAASTGTYTVNIGAVQTSANIQYRLNGGTWTTLTGYTAGVSTSGTIPGVTASDTIELRRTVNEAPNPNFVELQDPVATAVAYGTFEN